MKIASKEKRSLWVNLFVGMLPDAAIALIISIVTGEVVSFFFTIIGLQAVYFLIWLKNTIWQWLLFKLKTRREIKKAYLDHLKKNNFPEPDDYLDSASGYFLDVSENEEYPANLRVKAAIEATFFSSMTNLGQMQNMVRASMAAEDALEEYKSSFAGNDNPEINDVDIEDEEDADKELQAAQQIQHKCKWAEVYLKDQDCDMDEDFKEKSKNKLQKTIDESISIAEKTVDDFSKSTMLHAIADLLSKTGNYERAKELIDDIEVDFIQEKARDFLETQKAK